MKNTRRILWDGTRVSSQQPYTTCLFDTNSVNPKILSSIVAPPCGLVLVFEFAITADRLYLNHVDGSMLLREKNKRL